MKTKHLLASFVLGLSFTCVAYLVLMGINASPSAAAARPLSTNVGGVITQSTTWDLAGSPYILTDNVIVTNGVTLTVMPGVTVMGNSGRELHVLGRLMAIGTAAQPITFTSSADSGPTQWAGLSFDGGVGDLRYVTVRYGGQAGNSVGLGNIAVQNVLNGEVRIENSQLLSETIDYYLNTAQCLWIIDSHVTVSNSLFSGCAQGSGQYDLNYPAYIRGPGSVVTMTGNTFVNNYKNRIALEPDAMMGHDATLWPQAVVQGYELVMRGTDNFTVPAGITLTVMPGVIVMGNGNRELQVQGRLVAQGTPAQPITFTSVADSGPGQWSGLVFEGGAGDLRHTTVRYGGNVNSTGYRSNIMAHNVQSGEVRLESSRVISEDVGDAYVIDYGLLVDNSRATISDTLFSSCGRNDYYARDYPLYINGSASIVTLINNTFVNNVRDKIGLAPGASSAATHITMTRQAALKDYEFDGDYTVLPTMTLTIEPGVGMSGRSSLDELIVRGRFEAVGTATQPITFTSGNDSGWQQWPGVVFDGGTPDTCATSLPATVVCRAA